MPQGVILAVDRNRRNLELLAQFLGEEGHQVLTVSDPAEVCRIVSEPKNIALALVDIAGYDHQIWQCCERLHQAGVPLLVVSPRHSAAVERNSLTHGASGVLVKPLRVAELKALIRSILEPEAGSADTAAG